MPFYDAETSSMINFMILISAYWPPPQIDDFLGLSMNYSKRKNPYQEDPVHDNSYFNEIFRV